MAAPGPLEASEAGARPPATSIVAIIPLYNGARFIAESVASVLAQTRPPDEFLIVDDGSTDEGPAIVRRLAEAHPEIRLLAQPNGGQSQARNVGIAQSTGALIAMLDQDDTWYPDHLAELERPFLAPPTGIPLGWVYSELDRVGEDGRMLMDRFLRRMPVEHPKLTLAGCLRHDMHVLPSASLVSRAALESAGGFDEQLSGYEDDDLFLRLFRKGYRNVFLERPLSTWRRHGGATSYSPRMARSREIYLAKLIATYPDDPGNNRYPVRRYIAPRFFRNLLVRFIGAVEDRNREETGQARRDLAGLMPHLPARLRAVGLLLGVAMAAPPLGRLALAAWRTARPIVRRRQPAGPGRRA